MVEMTLHKPTFFCNSVCSTLGVISNFSCHKARDLLKSLNNHTHQWYFKNEQHIFRTCLPSIFASTINHHKTIRGNRELFVLKVLHLRDSLFLIGNSDNTLEIKNLDTGEQIDLLRLTNEEPLVDFDFYGDESQILVGFRSESILKVDMKKKTQSEFKHEQILLCQISYVKKMLGQEFITINKEGEYRAWSKQLKWRIIGQFHSSQHLAIYHRPYDVFIELENDSKNTLNLNEDSGQTKLAFIVQGQQMMHQIVIYDYFGYSETDAFKKENKGYVITIDEGQLPHSIKQFETKYLGVSLDRDLIIYNIIDLSQVRKLSLDQPFQFILRVNPLGYTFEFGLQGQACIAYSFKQFYECGILIAKGEGLGEDNFKELQDQEVKRRRKVLQIKEKPLSVISYCQYENGRGENLVILCPREDEDQLVIMKLKLI